MTAGTMITAGGVRRYLGDLAERVPVEVTDQCGSTNLELKERAAQLPPWYTLIARRQTGGRGRMGRSFFSPAGTGLYMSVLLQPALTGEDIALVTPAAAVAVCRAAEALGSDPAQIKWVNDVLVRDRKVCGILTEAVRRGDRDLVALGIGVNVTEPEGGFPADIAGTAGAVFPAGQGDMADRLAAEILRQLYAICAALPDRGFVAEYRARSCLAGRQVDVLGPGGSRRALVLGVDERCRLAVRYDDGTEQTLFSGEVSVRPAR